MRGKFCFKSLLSIFLCSGVLLAGTTSCRPQVAKSAVKVTQKVIGGGKASRAAERLASRGGTIGLTGATSEALQNGMTHGGQEFSPNRFAPVARQLWNQQGSCNSGCGVGTVLCMNCGGGGSVCVTDFYGNFQWTMCPSCAGRGRLPCPACN